MRNSICPDVQNKSAGVINHYVGRLFVVLILTFGLMTEASYAGNRRNSQNQQDETNKNKDISSSQAASIARGQSGGDVLKVKRDGDKYRVKILLPSGTVKTVDVDAKR